MIVVQLLQDVEREDFFGVALLVYFVLLPVHVVGSISLQCLHLESRYLRSNITGHDGVVVE